MTVQEAIAIVKSIKMEYQKKNKADGVYALDMSIKALEKQIAKKPIIKPWSSAKCPSCGCELSESLGDGYYRHYTYLGRCLNDDCGQKLDWGNEDAE